MSVTQAFLASQPEGAKDDSDEASLWREIEATSVLLADFVGGTHLWEALEVIVCKSDAGSRLDNWIHAQSNLPFEKCITVAG